MKVKLLTYWKDKDLVCCCPICNRCLKDRDCEELEFTVNPYGDLKKCMQGEHVYKRNKGALRQVK